MAASHHSVNHSRPNFVDSSEFNDPAAWDSASYEHHPVEDMEPWPEGSEFRSACVNLLAVLQAVDTFMSTAQSGAPMRWLQVSIGLGLHSTAGLTEIEIAERLGVSRQIISRGTVEFLRMVRLPPAFGLKSEAVRKKLQACH